ncbi:hypothetical protein QQF64_015515 [Cirrhinus molitorella]|uniref:Uncharacterized protein n=1 Tax=Cirrhinus molitorella TaxID=172907 RepID=A0ABR3NWP0_9TELE
MALTALLSAVHGMTILVTLPVTVLAINFACLDGKAKIADSLSAYLAVVRNMVLVRPPVNACACTDGGAFTVMSAYLSQGAYMAPVNNPGSAIVKRDGVACCATWIFND